MYTGCVVCHYIHVLDIPLELKYLENHILNLPIFCDQLRFITLIFPDKLKLRHMLSDQESIRFEIWMKDQSQ